MNIDSQNNDLLSLLQAKVERERLLSRIASRIRSSLNLPETLDNIVTELRQCFECDRVLVYQFQPDWTGVVVAESVKGEWSSLLGYTITDPCFVPDWLENYSNGRLRIVNDIMTEMMSSCHRDLLVSLQIRSKILVPILAGNRLWGLVLVAQNDAPRYWKSEEVELVQHISTQAAIAIQQAELYQQLQLELQERQRAELTLRQSEELYRTILTNISDAVFITDFENKFTFIGPNVDILFGYSVTEVAQMESIDCLLGQALFDPQQLLSSGEIANIEREIYDKQGNLHTVLVSVKRVQIGNGTVLYSCRDISERQAALRERKQVEKALQENEERLRTIVETNPSGIIAVNSQGTVVFANPTALKMFGMATKELEGWLLGFPYSSGNGKLEEIEIHQPSGKHRVVTMQTANITWQGENASLISLSDITEFKQVEASLRESEAKYRLLVENLPVGLVVHAPDTSIITCNDTACKLLELTPSQMQGKTALDPAWYFFREDETLMPLEEYPINQVLNTEQPLQNYLVGVNRPQSKTRIWALVNAFPLFDSDGYLQQVIVTFVDISERQAALRERKQAEFALKESESLFRGTFEQAAVGMCQSSLDGKFWRVNQKLCDIVGYSASQLLNLNFQEITYPDDLQTDLFLVQNLLAGNIQTYTLEKRYIRQYQAIIWVNLTVSLVRTSAGEPLYLIGVIEEISDRKQAEFALKESERRYATLAEAAPVGIFRINASGDCLYVNDRWCQIAELTANEALGQGWLKSIYPDDQNLVATEWYQSSQENRPFRLEYRFGRPDGKITWVFGQAVAEQAENGDIFGYIGTITDITSRKQAEEALQQLNAELEARIEQRTVALRASEERFRRYFEQSLIGMAIISPEQTWQEVNDRLCQILGYSRSELANMTWLDLTHPEDQREEVANFNRVLAGESDGYSMDKRFISQNGEIVYVIVSFQCVRRPDGSIDYFAKLVQDISDRKRAEQLLNESQAMLQLVLDTIPQRVFWKNRELVFLGCNRIFAQDIDLTPEQVIGMRSENLSATSEEIANYIKCDRRVMATGEPELHILETMHKPDGSFIWIETSKVPLRDGDGNIIGILGTYEDITSRRTAQEALRQSEERFQRIAANVPGMLYQYFLGRDGSISFPYLSDHCDEIFELDAALASKSPELMFNRIHPEDLPSINQSSQESATQLQRWKWEGRLLFPDGRIKWIQGIAQPELQTNGDIIWDGIMVDISDQKLAHEQLRKVNTQLVLANAELDLATRQKNEFMANMSHELRTPLNAILGMSEGLQDQVFGLLNDQQKQAVNTIERSGRHLLDLINDILDLSKVESGKLELQAESVAVSYLCESSLTFVRQQAIKKHLQLSTEIPPSLPNIIVDERRIRQVLINLLNNAVKFTPGGGRVKLVVQTEKQQDNYFICFSVIDTGIGISPENINKLFKPFVQIDSSLNRQYSGTGLGLALVLKLVELHNGTVKLTSEVGQGSCFTVCLPYITLGSQSPGINLLTPSEYPQQSNSPDLMIGAPTVSPIEAPSPPLILLAEDNEVNIATISSYLGAKGYRLLFAKNGQEAIDQSLSENPDLILMDIQMPGMDGLEAMRLLRAQPPFVRTPIIALTALAMPGDREKCLLAGANEYLTKPVKLKQLVEIIQQLLSTRNPK